MKKNYLIIFLLYLFIYNTSVFAKIENKIKIKVGNEIITSIEIDNEIKTILLLSKLESNNENIIESKKIALQILVNRLIKKIEIKKYKIEDYNKVDLVKYTERVAESLGTTRAGLKDIFKRNNLDYESFVNSHRINLLWNTLIFQLYKNQITINSVDIENELKVQFEKQSKKKEYNLSEIEIINSEEINKNLNVVFEELKQGSFSSVAKKYSVSQTSSNGGDLGWVLETILSKKILDQISDLSKGEVSRPIANQNSVVILKINNIRSTDTKEVDLEKLKNKIIKVKKEQKLDLFSRSHYTGVENSTLVSYQ